MNNKLQIIKIKFLYLNKIVKKERKAVHVLTVDTELSRGRLQYLHLCFEIMWTKNHEGLTTFLVCLYTLYLLDCKLFSSY